jgi:hypothetical protein
MHSIRRIPFVVTVLIVVSMTPLGLPVRTPAGQPPSAPSGSLQTTSTPPPAQGPHGSLVILHVRALVPAKVTLSDPVQRTVRATVLAIDEELNQIKLQTEAGQRLMLFLPPESLARLRVGTPCLLQVAVQSMRESLQLPERDGAFW